MKLYNIYMDDKLDIKVTYAKSNRTEKNLGIINNLDAELGAKISLTV